MTDRSFHRCGLIRSPASLRKGSFLRVLTLVLLRRSVFYLLLLTLAAAAYLNLRSPVFRALSSGTDWVLVRCGFAKPGEAVPADDRWRRLFYAVRMFQGTPPSALSAEDAQADGAYPGMGFGIVHTFSDRPVRRVIGGWALDIPCHYFTDARTCDRHGGRSAQLRVDLTTFAPITPQTVERFLAADSGQILRIELDAADRRDGDQRTYRLYRLSDAAGHTQDLYCLDPGVARQQQIGDHCLMSFTLRDDVVVTLRIPAAVRAQWPRLRASTTALVQSFLARA